MNDHQIRRFVSNLVAAMFDTVAGKRIAVFGAAFKPDTADTRESPGLVVVRALVEEQAHVVLVDPHALDNARASLGAVAGAVEFEPDPYTAAAGAHAIALTTAWPCFAELDYQRIFHFMRKPAFVFDGRNALPPARLHAIGFDVHSIGRPALVH
jgi:UDPglucose 6-dehydrogenase